MDKYITEYELNPIELYNHLAQSNSYIAGSFPLSIFLKENGIDPNFEPNDLDIWVPENIRSWTFCNFFTERGYKFIDKFAKQNKYNHVNSNIKTVYSYFKHGKEIQLIFIRGVDVVEHIKHSFDLTCCVTWFDNISREIKTLEPELTLKKEMKLLLRNDKCCTRVIKYEKRGFKLLDKKKDRISKILPVYNFYCNVRGFDCDKERKYIRPKILKTHNAAILIKTAFKNSQVKPNTLCGSNKMFDDFMIM